MQLPKQFKIMCPRAEQEAASIGSSHCVAPVKDGVRENGMHFGRSWSFVPTR